MQLSAAGLGGRRGMWELGPDHLARYREAVASDGPGAELEQVIALTEQAGVTVQGHGALKSAPRGYPADHPRIALLRYKGLTGLAAMARRTLAGNACGQGSRHFFSPNDPASVLLAHHSRRLVSAAAWTASGTESPPAAPAPGRAYAVWLVRQHRKGPAVSESDDSLRVSDADATPCCTRSAITPPSAG